MLIYKNIASNEGSPPASEQFKSARSRASNFSQGREQAIIKIPYEVPAEIRDLTEKSVEEARKAFERFVEAAHKATAQAEGTAHSLQSSAKDVSAQALSFTEANVNAAFDLAQKLVHAKDPQEILAHQSEYVKMQLAAIEEQAKELGTAVLKAVPPKK